MTTDNPDPLEVWNKAVDAYDERLFGIPSPVTRADRTAAHHAAAAIIAQHYAPVIAENERLREADAGDAPDEITNLKERVSLLEDALSMALSAIDDHNKRAAFRSIRIEEFYKPVPQRSKVACLTDARQALGAKP